MRFVRSATTSRSDVARRRLTGHMLARVVAKAVSILTVLRAEIIDGTIPAGTRLKEEAIAARFGVSRVPIREALLQLESEGFIHAEKYKGATVSARSEQDVVELMQVRRGLEMLASSRPRRRTVATRSTTCRPSWSAAGQPVRPAWSTSSLR